MASFAQCIRDSRLPRDACFIIRSVSGGEGNRQEENTSQVTSPAGKFSRPTAAKKTELRPKSLEGRISRMSVGRKDVPFFLAEVSVGAVKKLRFSLLGDSLAAVLACE